MKNMMKNVDFRNGFWLALVLMAITVLPFLGLTDFNSRGEPREAIVSVTMLQQGNWILPFNNGGEMAYKPPFFHWCISVFSLLGGHVTTYTSRIPSAIAALVMLLCCYVFYARRKNPETALLAILLCFSTFEVHRAIYACRVDMVLTCCIVLAIMCFYVWQEKRKWKYWLLAILCMSLGTLTKGPVAIILPCGCMGLYVMIEELWRNEKGRFSAFLPTWCFIVLAAALAVVLPSLWYYAAYQQGGENFLTLVKEENLDRFLGKMTYASHENPFWYYIPIGLASFLPWSLVPVVGLVLWLHDKGYQKKEKGWLQRLKKMDRVSFFSWVVFWTIFVFYCIPKSKRGVYILPLYPFGAWLIALYLKHMVSRKVIRRLVSSVLLIWLLLDAAVLPIVQNRKSDKDIASQIEQIIPADAYLTSYVAGSEPHNPMHYFTINYYLLDRVDSWKEAGENPEDGFLIIGEKDAPSFMEEHAQYNYTEVYTSRHRSCDTRQIIKVYHYGK